MKKLIEIEKVEPEEICIINLELGNSKNDFSGLRNGLIKNNISSITPGYVESADKFIEKGKVILTTPFRAKGNEISIVVIMNSQECII